MLEIARKIPLTRTSNSRNVFVRPRNTPYAQTQVQKGSQHALFQLPGPGTKNPNTVAASKPNGRWYFNRNLAKLNSPMAFCFNLFFLGLD